MKIGIISSGNETLALFKFLSRYDAAFLVYHDQIGFPYGEKSPEFVKNRIKEGIDFLLKQGAEAIIMDPVFELLFLQGEEYQSYHKYILPLFREYLHEYCFKYSLVGKLGILSDFGCEAIVQNMISKESDKYQLTDCQKLIKRFHFPFAYWVKSTSSRKYNISDLGVHNPFLIRCMKNDLRYFKDANVDTIIPMNYNYFLMQRSIKSFFNFRKIRFHDLSVLESCFQNLVKEKEKSDGNYDVHIWTNQPQSFLKKEKKLIRMLQRGQSIQLKIDEI